MKIINATPRYQYVFDNGNVVKEELKKEKGIITSFVNPKDIFSITKKFDASLSEETILLEMEKYIYTYPGIDINKEYQNIFLKINRNNNIILEAVLVDTEQLRNDFSNILDVYKYVDFISPSFLGWEEYYNITKIDPKNDVFIYLSEDEAFLTAFKDGKYLFHKSLNKLQILQKNLNKEMKDVIEILNTKGLDVSQYENGAEFNFVDKFFSEFFLRAFNVMNFSLNEYQIPHFDRLIFYSPFDIKGLFEQYENYWSLNGIEFKKSNISTEYDHLEYLITIYNANHYNDDFINLTIFSKPPSFFTTKAGKFFVFMFVCFILVLGYIGYEEYSIFQKQKDIKKFQKEYLYLRHKLNLEMKKVAKYRKDNKQLNKKVQFVENKIKDISHRIDILYEKSKEPLFYNVLAKITSSMQKYSLQAQKIIKNNQNITIIIVSDFDNTKEVTYFMKDLISYGFKNVKVSYISNQNDNYISKVDFSYE